MCDGDRCFLTEISKRSLLSAFIASKSVSKSMFQNLENRHTGVNRLSKGEQDTRKPSYSFATVDFDGSVDT